MSVKPINLVNTQAPAHFFITPNIISHKNLYCTIWDFDSNQPVDMSTVINDMNTVNMSNAYFNESSQNYLIDSFLGKLSNYVFANSRKDYVNISASAKHGVLVNIKRKGNFFSINNIKTTINNVQFVISHLHLFKSTEQITDWVKRLNYQDYIIKQSNQYPYIFMGTRDESILFKRVVFKDKNKQHFIDPLTNKTVHTGSYARLLKQNWLRSDDLPQVRNYVRDNNIKTELSVLGYRKLVEAKDQVLDHISLQGDFQLSINDDMLLYEHKNYPVQLCLSFNQGTTTLLAWHIQNRNTLNQFHLPNPGYLFIPSLYTDIFDLFMEDETNLLSVY